MTTHRFTRHVASALALALLAAASAAHPFQIGGFTVEDVRPLGSGHFGLPPPIFGRTVAGQLTGDLHADAVMMAGNQPVFLYGPGLYHALTDLPATANDIAVLRGAAPGGLDGLVTISDRGLELWWPDGTAQQFAHVALGSVAWRNATRVITADIDASGTMDVIALCGDQHTLRMLLDPMGASTESSIVMASTVYDFAMLDWDGTPQLEIAALTSSGVKVCRLAGAVLASYTFGVQGDVLAVLPGSGAAYDRLAGAFRVGANPQATLYVADKFGVEAGLALGALGATGAAVEDLDLDGRPDLVIAQQATHELLYFVNQGAGLPTFSLAAPAFKLLDTGLGTQPAPTSHATPALADLDLDGDVDILFPVQSSGSIAELPNRAKLAEDGAPHISGRAYQYDEVLHQGTLILRFEAPLTPLAGADAIELNVWRQETVGAETNPRAELHVIQTLGTWPQELSILITEPIEAFSVRNLDLRLTKTDASGTPIAAGPSSVGAFATRGSVKLALAELAGVPWEEVVLIAISGYTYLAGGDSDISAGVVPLPDVPDFDEDVVPDPKP